MLLQRRAIRTDVVASKQGRDATVETTQVRVLARAAVAVVVCSVLVLGGGQFGVVERKGGRSYG